MVEYCSGWWLSLPLWKMMDFVSWDDDIPNRWKNKIHVPNHQPVLIIDFFSTQLLKYGGWFSVIWSNKGHCQIAVWAIHYGVLWWSHPISRWWKWPGRSGSKWDNPKSRWNQIWWIPKDLVVGGIPTPLKNMSSSDGIIIPAIGEKTMFQTSNQSVNPSGSPFFLGLQFPPISKLLKNGFSDCWARLMPWRFWCAGSSVEVEADEQRVLPFFERSSKNQMVLFPSMIPYSTQLL